MTAAALVGLAAASGVLLVCSGLLPRPRPLAVAIDHLHRPPSLTTSTPDSGLMVRVIVEPLARSDLGRRLAMRVQPDLRVTGSTTSGLLAKQVTAMLAGLLLVPATAALMAAGGVSIGVVVPLWCSLVLGVGGAGLPLLELRVRARDRRAGFRHALGCFLDLVAVRLAGGAGIESALNESAVSGTGWAFTEIRHALHASRRRGEPPWVGLDRLGTELGVSELNELAASVTLAGDEGARVRMSVAAKARSIRTRGLANAESAAQSANERMSLPIVLLMLGFVLFLGYPAVIHVLIGL